jgi:hypothetical protein
VTGGGTGQGQRAGAVFAGLAALATVFVWKFPPETKELPVEEIVQVFEKQQRKAVLHNVT